MNLEDQNNKDTLIDIFVIIFDNQFIYQARNTTSIMQTRLPLVLLCFFIVFQGFAKVGSDSDTWRPSSFDCAPEVDVSISYDIDGDSTGVDVSFRANIDIGSTVYCDGERYTSFSNCFRLTELDISVDVYAGGSCIGRISTDISNFSSHSASFPGKKSYNNASFSLRNFRITDADFSGESTFKQNLAEELATKASRLEENGDWEEALTLYKDAKKIRDETGSIHRAICELDSKIDRYEDLISEGDKAYHNQAYFKAKKIYEKIEQELIIRSHTRNRLREINNRITQYKRVFQQACMNKLQARTADEWKATKKEFEMALSILPVDKKEQLKLEIRYAQSQIESIYDQHIVDGDKFYQQAAYVPAAKQYLKAINVYNRSDPQEKLIRSIRRKEEELREIYQPQKDHAIQEKSENTALAAAAINPLRETCYLERQKVNDCIEKYYTKLIQGVPEEVTAQIYENRHYSKPNNYCRTAACTSPLDNQQQNAKTLLATAKRKQQRYQENSSSEFREYRNKYLNRALRLNPKYIDAYLFKAELSSSVTERLQVFQQILAINPRHEETLHLKEQGEAKFSQSVFNFIQDNDYKELENALELGLLKQEYKKDGQNVVQFAIMQDHAYLLRLFFDNKLFLPEQINWDTEQLLSESIAANGKTCVAELVERQEVQVNLLLENQEAFLIQAIRKKSYEMVKVLLENGAIATVKSSDQETALTLALKQKTLDIGQLLLRFLEVEEIDQNSILITVINQYNYIFQDMIEKGIDINMKDTQQRSLLHLATAERDFEIAKLLIDQGAAMNLGDQHQESPLILAAKVRETRIASYLLSNNADVHLQNKSGETALYWAAHNQLDELTNSLLSIQADYKQAFHLFKGKGNTAATEYLALTLAYKGIAKQEQRLVLAAKNACPTVGFLAKKGQPSPLFLAAQAALNDMFWLMAQQQLQHTTAEKKNALQLAMDARQVSLVKRILADGTCNRMPSDKGFSIFNYAVRNGYEEETTALLRYVDINAQDAEGWTALHHAISTDQKQIIVLLIQKGADPKIKTKEGENAKKFARSQRRKYVKKLLKKS